MRKILVALAIVAGTVALASPAQAWDENPVPTPEPVPVLEATPNGDGHCQVGPNGLHTRQRIAVRPKDAIDQASIGVTVAQWTVEAVDSAPNAWLIHLVGPANVDAQTATVTTNLGSIDVELSGETCEQPPPPTCETDASLCPPPPPEVPCEQTETCPIPCSETTPTTCGPEGVPPTVIPPASVTTPEPSQPSSPAVDVPVTSLPETGTRETVALIGAGIGAILVGLWAILAGRKRPRPTIGLIR